MPRNKKNPDMDHHIRIHGNELKEATKDPKVNEYLHIDRKVENTLKSYEEYEKKINCQKTIAHVAELLDIWSRKYTSIILFDFLDEYGIPESSFYRWVESNKEIKNVHSAVMRRIGSRRLKLATFKGAECNDKFLLSTLRHYTKEHKDSYDEEVKNKLDSEKDNDRVTVILRDLAALKDKHE